jgi:hypothetical protein
MPIRCNRALLRAASIGAVVLALSGCTKGGQFDPTVVLDSDMFDSKPDLHGKREPVFPNGVPGAASGIPADLVKGYQPPPEQAANPDQAGPTPNAPPPDKAAEVKPKPKPKRKIVRARPQHPRTEITVGTSPRSNAPAQRPAQPADSAWPAPPPTTSSANPPQPAQSPWPAPPQQTAQPSQSIWPNPPPTTSQ